MRLDGPSAALVSGRGTLKWLLVTPLLVVFTFKVARHWRLEVVDLVSDSHSLVSVRLSTGLNFVLMCRRLQLCMRVCVCFRVVGLL